MPEHSDDQGRRVFVRDPAEDLRRWLRHRLGLEPFRPTIPGSLEQRRALQLNRDSDPLLKHGAREIEGFIAFVDLRGFSDEAKGKDPRVVHEFINPFLERVVRIAVRNKCLVDKTIGDEVMLVLPDMSDVGAYHPWLHIGWVLDQLAEMRKELGPRYTYRIGLSYGPMYLGQVGSESFTEWTVFGEAVNLAKRLHSLVPLDAIVDQHGVGVACGVLARDLHLLPRPPHPGTELASLGPFWMRGWVCKVLEGVDRVGLKGISEYEAMVLAPIAESDSNQHSGAGDE